MPDTTTPPTPAVPPPGPVSTAPAEPLPGTPQARPVRIGVFRRVRDADLAVRGLLAAGFASKHISVICSDKFKAAHFPEFTGEQISGATTPVNAGSGAVVGGLVAGILATGVAIATGGIGLIIAGPLFAGAGAVLGSFVGAMMSRGVERDVADYYDQALRGGEILVAAEIESDEDVAKLARAEAAFHDAGARPMALLQG
jgi:hypothetical protein